MFRMRLLLAASAMVVGIAAADTLKVSVGSSSIALPEPSGMTALKDQGSPFFKWNEEVMRKQNIRTIAYFASPANAKMADSGQMIDPDQWIVFAASPVAFEKTITAPVFRSAVDGNLKGVQAMLSKQQPDSVNSLLKEKGASGSVKVGQMVYLGVFANEPSYAAVGSSFLVAVSQNGKQEIRPMLSIWTMMRLKERLVSVYYNRRITSQADIDEAKRFTLLWLKAVVAQNPD